MVYPLILVAALLVAIGEVIQQRSAATAPPEHNLSIRLLVWLVRRPRWLAGVASSTGGNAVFAVAVGFASLALVEALFVVRLLFALVLAALWGRHRVPARDLLGSLAITVGLVAFIVVAQPHSGPEAVSDLHWILGGGCVLTLALVLTVIAKGSPPARKAALLGAAAGSLFGLQASLTQSAVHVLKHQGLVALLMTWHGYAVIAVALFGMLLVQSAFEAAPLPASYPAVVTAELIVGVAVGVFVLNGTLRLGTVAIIATAVSLLVMIGGIYLLTTSPLVTGQLDRLVRQQDIGRALQIEQRLARELQLADQAAQRLAGGRAGGTLLRQELRRIEGGIERLCELQDDIRRHRDAEEQRLDALPAHTRDEFAASARALLERERVIDEHAQRLRARAHALAAAGGVTWSPGTEE
ncbi:MAG: DMT family transporter [Pseudonocardiaceae bacterium]